MTINDSRNCLEAEFKMLMEFGERDQAQLVLEQLKSLKQEVAAMSTPPSIVTDGSGEVSAAMSTPPSIITDGSGEVGYSVDVDGEEEQD